MKQRYFIAGTDTEIGKTTVSAALLRTAQARGFTTLGLKPLAAGAEQLDGHWRNDDALQLQAASSLQVGYDTVNPVLLRQPMAPHLAAELENRRLSVTQLAGFCRGALMSHPADITLIEGAGGWLVPINGRETLADLARELNLGVILVVGMKLGCLNHALLTARAIAADGLTLVGWIANEINPSMMGLADNLATLQRLLPAPLLGHLPHLAPAQAPPADWLSPRLWPAD